MMRSRFGNDILGMTWGAMAVDDEERAAITLVCLFCSKEQEIRVPKSMVSNTRVIWECLSCQARETPPKRTPSRERKN